jgi:hypothetical protein
MVARQPVVGIRQLPISFSVTLKTALTTGREGLLKKVLFAIAFGQVDSTSDVKTTTHHEQAMRND